MALINCEECGREVSDRAAACPHCGCPVTPGAPTSRTTPGPRKIKSDRRLGRGARIALVAIVGSLAVASGVVVMVMALSRRAGGPEPSSTAATASQPTTSAPFASSTTVALSDLLESGLKGDDAARFLGATLNQDELATMSALDGSSLAEFSELWYAYRDSFLPLFGRYWNPTDIDDTVPLLAGVVACTGFRTGSDLPSITSSVAQVFAVDVRGITEATVWGEVVVVTDIAASHLCPEWSGGEIAQSQYDEAAVTLGVELPPTITLFGTVRLVGSISLYNSAAVWRGLGNNKECWGVGVAEGAGMGAPVLVKAPDGQTVAGGQVTQATGYEGYACVLKFEVEDLVVVDPTYDITVGPLFLLDLPAQDLVDHHLNLRLKATGPRLRLDE